jgi:hypothetical protein
LVVFMALPISPRWATVARLASEIPDSSKRRLQGHCAQCRLHLQRARYVLAMRSPIGDEEKIISGGAIRMDVGLTGKVALATRAGRSVAS